MKKACVCRRLQPNNDVSHYSIRKGKDDHYSTRKGKDDHYSTRKGKDAHYSIRKSRSTAGDAECRQCSSPAATNPGHKKPRPLHQASVKGGDKRKLTVAIGSKYFIFPVGVWTELWPAGRGTGLESIPGYDYADGAVKSSD